ncbi:MAG: MucR family transcriptional regulator [Alphaproteobacteria bacterium]|nr:MucR family transcriptional regulator [Alphaproteobacteria bacterium]
MTEHNALNAADRIIEHVATIVAAYASSASLSEEALIAAIRRVHSELAVLGGTPGQGGAPMLGGASIPAVPVRKSVTPDYIVCLEDGQRVKMLKRYIMTHYKQTPAQYRAKWGLPPEYPMVAPNYAKRRSELAKAIGLGTKANVPKDRAARERRAGARG